MMTVHVEALTPRAFEPFGALLDLPVEGGPGRFDRQAPLSDLRGGLAPNVALIRAAAEPLPSLIERMERHPFSTQLFAPLGMAARFLVVVAPGGVDGPDLAGLRAFCCEGARAIAYKPGIWHHPLLSLVPCRFLMLVHEDGGDDDTHWFDLDEPVALAPTMP